MSKENVVILADLLSEPIIHKTDILDLILQFIKVTITLNPHNNISVIINDTYILPNQTKENVLYLKYPRIERTFRKNIKELLKKHEKRKYLLDIGLTKALCRINKTNKNLNFNNSKIIIFQTTKYSENKFIKTLNCSYAAQKMRVNLDIIDLTKSVLGCPLLKKLSGNSNGFYFHPSTALNNDQITIKNIYSILISYFILPKSTRENFKIPKKLNSQHSEDFNKILCFCCKELGNIGFVCSSCLAVFCKKAKICTLCQTLVN